MVRDQIRFGVVGAIREWSQPIAQHARRQGNNARTRDRAASHSIAASAG
jgi:hypothetical protein